MPTTPRRRRGCPLQTTALDFCVIWRFSSKLRAVFLSIGAGRPPSRTGGSMSSCDVSDKKLRWLKSIRRIRTFVATYAPPFVLFMAPALINGFPLMFEGDSGGYLAHGILRDHAPVRPIYYCYFLFA